MINSGFSSIDLVFEKVENKLVYYALKRIQCYSKLDETKAYEEARFHFNLPKHPNLLNSIGYGLLPLNLNNLQKPISEVFIVMELGPKGSLQTEIDKLKSVGQSFSQKFIISMIRGICKALEVFLKFSIPVSHR